ncbi:MAG: alpha/beta hydrolase [Aeromicrobium sp.]|uniref:alpha/beta fold hydrolase n=1 Tax=Aeromicrobium sp. TaxID=1871063 RepID=UPI0039E309C3
MSDETRELVTSDGTRLWVEIDGPDDAPLTVVFVHGFTLNLANFAEQRAAWTDESVRRVFYDQRAFGRSERGPRGAASIRRLAGDLAEVIESLDGPVVIVGHSMGGMVAAALAGLRPDLIGSRVVGTMLIATTGRGTDITMLGLEGFAKRFGPAVLKGLHRTEPLPRLSAPLTNPAVAWLFHDLRSTRAHRRAFIGMVEQTPFDVMADYLRAMLEFDEYDSLAALAAVPSVVVAGASDRITPVSANRYVADAIGAELVVAGRAGHMVPFERADVVNQQLAALLSRVRAQLG